MFRPGVVDVTDQLFCFLRIVFSMTPSSPLRVRLGRSMSSDSDISKGFPKCLLSMGSEPRDYNICSSLPTYYSITGLTSANADTLPQRTRDVVMKINEGNLVPGVKITGKGTSFTGKARVFDDEDDFITAVEQNQIPLGEKTRCGYPVRRPQRQSRHARDAETHFRDHGR